MLIFNKYRRPFFYDPHQGGASGGAAGNPAANQGGAPEPAAGAVSDPFAGINLDDLDSATRQIVEDGRKKFAATQAQLDAERKTREHNEQLARSFQAKHDALAAQIQRLNGGQAPANPEQQKEQMMLAAFEKTLREEGVKEDQVKGQAQLMLKMLNPFAQQIKAEIGKDMMPFAHTVMQQSATAAWNEAASTDQLGALQEPTIASKVWTDVQNMVNAGQNVDAPTIKNLSYIYYAQHVESGAAASQPPPPPQVQHPPLPNTTRLTYPGAGAAPFRPAAPDPNAARTTLDPATAAAVNAVMNVWKGTNNNPTGKPTGR